MLAIMLLAGCQYQHFGAGANLGGYRARSPSKQGVMGSIRGQKANVGHDNKKSLEAAVMVC